MRAVQAREFGPPDVLVPIELPEPTAGPGQVVVGVKYAPVLFLDTQIRSGWGRDWFSVTPPYTPGSGVAGEISSAGPGVDPEWVGRRVVADTPEGGGYLERTAVEVSRLVAIPEALGTAEAAALLHDGRTAMGLAEVAGCRPGEWVLAATGGAGPDVVFDGVGGQIGQAAFAITARGGRFSAHGAPSGGFAPIDRQDAERHMITVWGIEQAQFALADARRLTERALAEAAAGRIRPIIGQTFPLDQAADAHRAIEARDVIGKTLLVI